MKFNYLIILVLFTHALFGQNTINEMVTDRPDITESAITVPLHYLQIETGYQYNVTEFDYTYHYASTLLRYGLTANIELRFAGEYQSLKKRMGTIVFGVEDNFNNFFQNEIKGIAGTMAGAKFQVINEKEKGSNFAVLAQLFLPWGKSGLVPDKIEPEIIFSFGTKFAKRLGIGINTGFHWNSNSENLIIFYSVSSGISLSNVVSIFAEYSGDYENKTSKNNFMHIIDGGFIVLVKKNIQIDLYAGINVIPNDLDWFWGSGISVRFPK